MNRDKPQVVTLFLPRSLVALIDEAVGREHREKFITSCIRIGLADATAPGMMPPVLECLEDAGLAALEAHDHRAARRWFERIAKIKPDYADAWTHLGIIDYRARRYQQAKDLFQKGENLAKDELVRKFGGLEQVKYWWGDVSTRPYMRARYNLALATWKLGDHDGAIRILRELLQMNPGDDQGARFLIATVERDLKKKLTTGSSPQSPGARRQGRLASPEIYQLKVTLRGSKPPIWRRFRVRSDMTLAGLHGVLQTVMGWWDCHLYRFEIGGKEYGEPDPDFNSEFPVINAAEKRLCHVLPGAGGKFLYEYDFGDSWVHTIEIERLLSPEEGVRYPVCLAGKRACPPEDCGGLGGYEHLLEVIRDPEHEDYQETIDWLGGQFDPEAFNLDEVNEALHSFRTDRHPNQS